MKDKKLGKKYSYVNNNPYQFISTDYRNDVKELLDFIKQENKTLAGHISIEEHYPFWQLYGYSTYVYYKNIVVAHVIHHNRRCTPFKITDAYAFKGKNAGKEKGKIQIGSFSFTFLMNLCNAFKYRVLRDNKKYQFYNIMTSHLVEMRNYYMDKSGKQLLDDSLFQEFVTNCIGDTMNPLREKRLERKMKYLQKKFPIVWNYDPSQDRDNKSRVYRFPNSSGNSINNEKNYRIVGQDIPRLNEDRKGDDQAQEVESDEDTVLEAKELEESVSKKKNEKKN
jgi:hypothetical protein